jgi:hypothetical protein
MRISTKLALTLATLLLGSLLVPQAALAGIANCPTEPATNVPIASGGVYAGSNCVLHTPGDVDSFVFSANAGDTYQLALGYQGGATNVCLTLYDPNSVKIIPQTCTTANGIAMEKTLTTPGKYLIVITEPTGGGQSVDTYALSLERINPLPPDAQPIMLASVVNGAIAAPTEQNVYTFFGATTGTYQVSITYTGGPINACVNLYDPGTISPISSSGCTTANTFQFDFDPPENATYMVLINGLGNDSTVTYNFEVSCVIGTCPTRVPTTTKLTSSPNPSGDGQAVTFTATVSSSGGTPPNGETVSFKTGTTVLGTGTLSSGKATFSDSKLTAGATTPVTAVYAGDSNFQGSTSNTVEQVVYGPCTLIDVLSYSATTLTMKFTIGNNLGTTAIWNAWLTYADPQGTDPDTMQLLFSTMQPITNPPKAVTKTLALPKEGTVGILSTLSTSKNGIACSSWVKINTGTDPLSP